MYDKTEGNLIYKIEDLKKKHSDAMIGIQIHLEYNWIMK